ncbi:Translin-associated factor X-interacting protein 1 [Rhizophlyctis rosea]|nr:Translin-associated factor X-interacting protein 1 [Rhizophlyctis rosea]
MVQGSGQKSTLVRFAESQIPQETYNSTEILSKSSLHPYTSQILRPTTPPPPTHTHKHAWTTSRSDSPGAGVKAGLVGGENVDALYPGDKTRPRFLVAMLHQVRAELVALGAENAPLGDSRRLQVYGEIWDFFIQEFKTYEPLLTEIKHEYECHLQNMRQEVAKLEPLQSKLAVYRYQAAQELDQVQAEWQKVMDRQKWENRELRQTIRSLNARMDSLRNEYTSLKEELRRRDDRGEDYVSSKLVEVHAEMESLERKHNAQLRVKEQEIVDLQTGLKKDFNAMTEEMNKVKDHYGSIMKKERDAFVGEVEGLRSELQAERGRWQSLESRNAQIQSDLHQTQAALKRKEDDKYPDWDYIQNLCPSSVLEWGMKCKDLDYNDTIIVLLRDLIKLKVTKAASDRHVTIKDENLAPTDPKYFIGLGLSSDLPKYLRYRGKIPNRHISRKNLRALIKDTWEQKAIYDALPARKGQVSKLADFLYAYLKKRFGSQEIVAEWGYNIHEACRKHRFYSVEIQLFFGILTDTMEEEVYHHQTQTIERLKTMFYRMDMDLHEGKARGVVPKAAGVEMLKRAWTQKDERQFGELSNALDADQPGAMLTYRWLFQSDAQSMFLDIVREQEMELREAYLNGVASSLLSSLQAMSAAPPPGTTPTTKTPIEQLRTFKVSSLDAQRALARHDPQKTKKGLDTLVARGFGVKVGEVKLRAVIGGDKFVENLRRGVLYFGAAQKEQNV